MQVLPHVEPHLNYIQKGEKMLFIRGSVIAGAIFIILLTTAIFFDLKEHDPMNPRYTPDIVKYLAKAMVWVLYFWIIFCFVSVFYMIFNEL